MFRPNESQMYYYYGKDKTEVYWIHFTGRNVEDLLKQYNFPNNKNVIMKEEILNFTIVEGVRLHDHYAKETR